MIKYYTYKHRSKRQIMNTIFNILQTKSWMEDGSFYYYYRGLYLQLDMEDSSIYLYDSSNRKLVSTSLHFLFTLNKNFERRDLCRRDMEKLSMAF